MNGSWTVSRFLWLRLFLLKAEEVSDRQRWRAKMINYLLTSGSSLLWYRMKQHRNKDRTICHSSNEIGSMFEVSDKKYRNHRKRTNYVTVRFSIMCWSVFLYVLENIFLFESEMHLAIIYIIIRMHQRPLKSSAKAINLYFCIWSTTRFPMKGTWN